MVEAGDPSPARPRVAVIGGGVAGLSAAGVLKQRGCTVVVFDKGRRPGGRLASRRDEYWAFDHGAQYFTAKDPRFREVVQKWTSSGVIAAWSGRIGVFDGNRLSPAGEGHTRYVGVPEMNALAAHLAADLDVRPSVRITGLRWEAGPEIERPGSKGKWTLTDEAGQFHSGFDAVIVALPADQAKPLLAGAEGMADGQDVPDVPEIEMSPCWCVMLGLDVPTAAPFDGVFVNDGPISWMARNNSKPGRPESEAWVIHAGPDWSARHLEDDPIKVGPALIAAAESVLGQPLAPAHTRTHRWRYAMGSAAEDGTAWDSGLSLGIAGDWLGGGRVEGAWLSGLMVAEELVRDFDI